MASRTSSTSARLRLISTSTRLSSMREIWALLPTNDCMLPSWRSPTTPCNLGNPGVVARDTFGGMYISPVCSRGAARRCISNVDDGRDDDDDDTTDCGSGRPLMTLPLGPTAIGGS